MHALAFFLGAMLLPIGFLAMFIILISIEGILKDYYNKSRIYGLSEKFAAWRFKNRYTITSVSCFMCAFGYSGTIAVLFECSFFVALGIGVVGGLIQITAFLILWVIKR